MKQSDARKKLMDDEARAYAKGAAKQFSKGTYTASQTGARKLAQKRADFSDMGELMKSLESGTDTSENYIKTRKYKGR